MSASRRRRNDTTNRPIRTGTPRNHHRYSGAAKRIRPPRDGARSALDLWASWNLPQQGGRQGEVQENEHRPRVEKPRELFGVTGVAAHLDLGALHPIDRDRKSTRLNSVTFRSRMPSSA